MQRMGSFATHLQIRSKWVFLLMMGLVSLLVNTKVIWSLPSNVVGTELGTNNDLHDWFWEVNPARDETHKTTRKKKLLIAQTADRGIYRTMLDVSQKANRAYARRHGYDYAVMVGLPWEIARGRNKLATYNKVEVLSEVLRFNHRQSNNPYDAVLIMDADAILVDFEFDIADLLEDKNPPPGYATYSAVITNQGGTGNLGDINIGVALWNLRHPETPFLAKWWKTKSLWALCKYNQLGRRDPARADQDGYYTLRDDQTKLSRILEYFYPELPHRSEAVRSVNGDLQNTRVKHVLRDHGQGMVWADKVDDSRLETIRKIVDDVCGQFERDCQGFPDQLNVTTVAPSRETKKHNAAIHKLGETCEDGICLAMYHVLGPILSFITRNLKWVTWRCSQ